MSGIALNDQLAVQPQIEPQNAVRRRMLRAHRERHLRLERRVEDLLAGNVFCNNAHIKI